MIKIGEKDQENRLKLRESEPNCENLDEFCESEDKILGLLQEKNIKSESKELLLLKY